MKKFFISIILFVGLAEAAPLQKGVATRKYADKIRFLIGQPIHRFLSPWEKGPDQTTVKATSVNTINNEVIQTVYFKEGTCQWVLNYDDDDGLVTDVYISTEICIPKERRK